MLKKNAPVPVALLPVSFWEQEWTKDDYRIHDKELRDMRSEYRNLYHSCGEDGVLAQWRLYEKDKAVRIEYQDGEIVGITGKKFKKYNVIVINQDSYRVMAAKMDKFSQWLFVQEKIEMTSEERSAKLKDIFKGMVRPRMEMPVAPEIPEEQLTPEEIEKNRVEFEERKQQMIRDAEEAQGTEFGDGAKVDF